MGVSSMKVHQFARGATFYDQPPSSSSSSGLTLDVCKRLRPLATTETCFAINSSAAAAAGGSNGHVTAAFDLKSFIRPESSPVQLASPDHRRDSPQVETHPGGTRWNPTQEQIGILEMLYRGGMRTPNAQQIEQITAQLGRYGKIEGKNVFYWFQNHKARERQKQKRGVSHLGLTRSPRPTTTAAIIHYPTGEVVESPYKRKCRSWSFESLDHHEQEEEEEDHKTLELFPLLPEGRSRSS